MEKDEGLKPPPNTSSNSYKKQITCQLKKINI